MLVESTAVRAIRYDAKAQRLHVTFVSGERYAYENVPGELYARFGAAESKGRFFQAEIRDRYPFTRLR